MSDPIDLPPELQHLVEKRENDEDRRKKDTGPPEQQDSAEAEADAKQGAERRKQPRRATDQE